MKNKRKKLTSFDKLKHSLNVEDYVRKFHRMMDALAKDIYPDGIPPLPKPKDKNEP